MLTETLKDGHQWWRIARADWGDPLDPAFAQRQGGRWNPPNSFPTLYLNEDHTTARANMQLFADQWPYEPEDLRPDNAPILVGAFLPRRQHVADAHTRDGVVALSLPSTYPFNRDGSIVTHALCQQAGVIVLAARVRGIRCRSARTGLGAGRELAWFPAGARSRARQGDRLVFADWFWH